MEHSPFKFNTSNLENVPYGTYQGAGLVSEVNDKARDSCFYKTKLNELLGIQYRLIFANLYVSQIQCHSSRCRPCRL